MNTHKNLFKSNINVIPPSMLSCKLDITFTIPKRIYLPIFFYISINATCPAQPVLLYFIPQIKNTKECKTGIPLLFIFAAFLRFPIVQDTPSSSACRLCYNPRVRDQVQNPHKLHSFVHNFGVCKIARFLAVVRRYFHSSRL